MRVMKIMTHTDFDEATFIVYLSFNCSILLMGRHKLLHTIIYFRVFGRDRDSESQREVIWSNHQAKRPVN